MKKTYFLFLGLIIVGQSAFSLTINNTTAGGLNLAAVGTTLLTATDLKITGVMDQRDFKYIQYYVPSLTTLDLSNVTIVAYSTYPANTIPLTAFTPVPPNNYTQNLQTITLPSTITSIDNQAFYGCTGLTTVIIPSTVLTTMVSGAFYGCANLTSINIPSSVISLGASVFFGCSKLTSINIPSSVTLIGNAAFSGCSGLTTIYANNVIPVNLSSALYTFNNVNKSTCILHVPIGSTAAYQAAVVWQDFSIAEGLSSDVKNTTSSQIKVYTHDSNIVVEGTSAGEIISVYALNGLKMQTILSQGERITILVKSNGVYLVKTAGKTAKVIL